MQFDPNNKVIQLCASGMAMETKGQPGEARLLFLKAWEKSTNDFEKFISAHYVARQQKSIEDKLKWDQTALGFALKITDNSMTTNYPSLYLNIAKCYEDLKDPGNAWKNYEAALSYASHLPGDGYGRMIRSGIKYGMDRISETRQTTAP